MTLRNLQIFLAVAESGSMVKAASNLYMTQPSISQVISEIEKTYNVTLFERKSRALRLTKTGENLVEYAKKALLAAKEAEDFLNYESSHPQISVGATPTIGACIMGPVVAKLHEAIPNLVHQVRISNASSITNDLINGNIDIALIEGPVDNPEIESRAVIRDRIVLVCSREHQFRSSLSIDIGELANQSIIMREDGSAIRTKLENEFKARDLELNVSWSSSNYDAITHAVKYNLGVGVITERFSRKERIRKTLHICEISGIDTSFNYHLAYRKGRIFPESLMEFIRICEELGALDDILSRSE